jgi:membrane protease YdiL (CAAX protease family)
VPAAPLERPPTPPAAAPAPAADPLPPFGPPILPAPSGQPVSGPAPWPLPPAGWVPPGALPHLPAAPGPPRVWTAIVVPIIAVLAATVTSTIVVVVAAGRDLGLAGMADQQRLSQWVESFGSTPGGFLALVLPGQSVFLAAALLAAWLSPVPLRRRLGLVRPSVPWWGLLLLVAATPAAAYCGHLLMSALFDEPSENLEMLERLFGGRTGLFLLLVTLSISLLPGVSEELLFRGYAQRRLLQRWHPAAAIGLSAVLFSAAHVDPAHVVGVLPLGVWLGVMAWLCGSTWPAMLCHATNNATAVLLTNLGSTPPDEPVEFGTTDLVIVVTSGVCLVLSVWVMLRHRKPAEPADSAKAAPPVLPPPAPPQPWNATT